MYRNYTESFTDPELDELVKEGFIVGYTYEGEEDYEILRITLSNGPDGVHRSIRIKSRAGYESNSSLSVDVY